MKMTAPQSLKFMKLKRRMAKPHYVVVGLLESIWLFTQTNAPHGDIGRHSNEDIASGIEWDGDHDKLIEDLISCGWIDRCPVNRLLIHDWEDHVPTYLKGSMAKNGQDFARHGELPVLARYRIAREDNQPPKQPAEQPPKQPAKQPAKHGAKEGQNIPEQPAPRLGLSGLAVASVEKPGQTDEDSSTTASPPHEPTTALQQPTVCVLTFPCAGKSSTWELTQKQIDDWAELYPSLDILAECRKALAWVAAKGHKTAKGMPAFLVNWFNRSTDRSSQGSNQRPAYQTKGQQLDDYFRQQFTGLQ